MRMEQDHRADQGQAHRRRHRDTRPRRRRQHTQTAGTLRRTGGDHRRTVGRTPYAAGLSQQPHELPRPPPRCLCRWREGAGRRAADDEQGEGLGECLLIHTLQRHRGPTRTHLVPGHTRCHDRLCLHQPTTLLVGVCQRPRDRPGQSSHHGLRPLTRQLRQSCQLRRQQGDAVVDPSLQGREAPPLLR